MAIVDWLQKALIEKWLGRALVLALAALGGWLAKYIPADMAQSWVEITKAVVEAGLPILLAWILGMIRHRAALAVVPPVK